MPCRVSGCKGSWIWFGSQQVRSLGQSPPDRMCDHHLAQLNELGDIDVNCRNPGCPNTWLWKRGAQLAQLAKFGKLKRPARLCDECFASERQTTDEEVACKVDTCLRTWTWTREAQLRHRLWVRRQWLKAEKAAARARREAEEAAAKAAAKAEAVKIEAAKAEAAKADADAVEAKSVRAEASAGSSEPSAQPRAQIVAEGADVSPAVEPAESTTRDKDEAVAAGSVAAAESTTKDRDEAVATEAKLGESTTKDKDKDKDKAVATEAKSGESTTKEKASDETATDSAKTDGEKGSEPLVGADEEPSKRKRRRRRRRGKKGKQEVTPEVAATPAPVEIPEGPPARMCSCCSQKVAKSEVKELPCKVHGCTRTWSWDRASQLRAWAALGTDDLSAEPHAPRRMCETCRDFCRSNSDQAIPCGRPGCENTWTHKVGAQLQSALAGRTQVPMRLCDACSRGGFISSLQAEGQELPPGAERMPCVVSGCSGSWVWFSGQKVLATEDKDGLVIGKMCLSCRHERGVDLEVAEPTADESEAPTSDVPVSDAGAKDAAAGDAASAGSTESTESTESTKSADASCASRAEGAVIPEAESDAQGVTPAAAGEPSEPEPAS